jgi:hypothetical protein
LIVQSQPIVHVLTRVGNADVVRLARLMPVGTPVRIR